MASPVVLVTGAAQRIGRVIATTLARQGWRVAVHHRRSADEARALVAELTAELEAERGGSAQAAAFAADLADEAACAALVPAVIARLGRIDAVVHNASLFEHDDVASFNYATMERHWRANTAPAIVLGRALHAALLDRAARAPSPTQRPPTHAGPANADAAPGVLITLLDQKLWNPNPDHLSYTLSKAALEAATTLLAQALAPQVRVCGVAPGVTLPSGDMNAAEFAASHRMTPLERSSTPEDVAEAVAYLLRARAVTGTTLLVDGGQHLQPQPRDVMFIARAAEKPTP
jgi:NAD(P)-dependent dehydrogenase (short-subunit alcohol dehydrogenase family)